MKRPESCKDWKDEAKQFIKYSEALEQRVGDGIKLMHKQMLIKNKDIDRLRKALAVLKEMIKINGDNANTVQMHELIDEALKEA